MVRYIANLCLMADFGISKKRVCLMVNSSVNIDKINELDPQMTFDELQNIFEKSYHDYKKLYKKKICFKINLILFQKILMYYKKRMMSY
jgi:hypothetical protein